MPKHLSRLLQKLPLAAMLVGVIAAADETVPRIGVLPLATPFLREELRQGLRELGYVEGSTILIDWSTPAQNDPDLTRAAVNLARGKPYLIVASGSLAARAALTATQLPVVFAPVGDPVASGFAASIPKPGGRGTGVSIVTTELAAKRLEILRLVAPRARSIAYLMNSANPVAAPQLDEAHKAAHALGVNLVTLDVRRPTEIDTLARAIRASSAEAVLVSGDLLFLENAAAVVRGVRSTGLPTLFPVKDYHAHGALMSYGTNLKDVMRRASTYVDRILKGARPADLPIEQMSTYELTVDLKVARAMNLSIPKDLLLRANEVIQ
jgi:putative ABC transport system substrate-binding protein